MNAEIIAVGSELLLGQINNTNARFLSAQLAGIGVNVFYHTVVGDNPERLKKALEIAEGRSSLVIFTGGLGPTKDDLTKETIARHLGMRLVLDDEAMVSIEQFFKRANREMTENNRKQALILEGADVLKNEHGMAPGMLVSKGKHHYMLLPGPPSEMEPMFAKYGLLALAGKMDGRAKIVSRVLRFFGIGEAALETRLEHLIDKQTNPTIAPLAGEGEVTIRLTARAESDDLAWQLIDGIETDIMEIAGEHFYGYDDTSLMKELSGLLASQGLTLAAAESLTGGMFQQEMTSLAGASKIFKGGFVCYTNEAKINVVGVNAETIDNYGAVSEQCACELADNAARLLGADIGISFTGVAGPDDLEGHPPGTVFIGIAAGGRTWSKKITLSGSRKLNRLRTVKNGSHILLKYLKEAQDA
ncbi:competence/damage-inducible protein A [Mesobacillus zeae]|uniref:Putative competence-damage inducible protein n=1 Tax=Mesobacillus zeae TaxID=1917180 RepID=A0A398BE53_9BACI|nr:competence/damage-inducible protein A [Mesobacillus zeae]RID88067.1 competence/damage-inducible protein A [Mesobacillus zeae]